MHVVDFFPKFLCHSQGKWAGDPFELDEGYIENIILPLFGWVRDDGLRRYRQTYIEMPKKQGKSAVASGLGIYGLCGDGEAGSHCYSFGADKEQARVVHKEAISMVEKSPELAAVLDINNTTGVIKYTATDSWYMASSSATRGKHGIKQHFGICDELHEWFGRKLWDQLKYAGGSREQPMRFVITNAGDDIESVCYEQREKALRIESGASYDDTFFGLVLRVPEADAEDEINRVGEGADSLPVARLCNPMIDKITAERDLIQDVRDAVETPSERPNLMRLRYGIWVQSSENPLLPQGAWKQCQGVVDETDLIGCPCAAAIDLAEINDMTSMSIVWPQLDEKQIVTYKVLSWNWLARRPATAKLNKNAAMYKRWELDPLARLRLTDGDVTDFTVVRNEMLELLNKYQPRVFLFDPRNAEKLTQELSEGVRDTTGATVVAGSGVERVPFAQTITNYAEPTAEFERAVIEKRIEHDGNPILEWEANHCSYERDKEGNKKPVKPGHAKDSRKVDSVQTMVMAIGGCQHYVDMGSAYASSGSGVVLF